MKYPDNLIFKCIKCQMPLKKVKDENGKINYKMICKCWLKPSLWDING